VLKRFVTAVDEAQFFSYQLFADSNLTELSHARRNKTAASLLRHYQNSTA
jgi:hypothetical protein